MGMGIAVDLTISLGTIVETILIAGGGVATVITLRNTITVMKADQSASKDETKKQFEAFHTATKEQFEAFHYATKEQFKGVQDELEKLGEILVVQARQDERMINFDHRLTAHGRQIDELRRGEGFIRGAPRGSVDGEYK